MTNAQFNFGMVLKLCLKLCLISVILLESMELSHGYRETSFVDSTLLKTGNQVLSNKDLSNPSFEPNNGENNIFLDMIRSISIDLRNSKDIQKWLQFGILDRKRRSAYNSAKHRTQQGDATQNLDVTGKHDQQHSDVKGSSDKQNITPTNQALPHSQSTETNQPIPGSKSTETNQPIPGLKSTETNQPIPGSKSTETNQPIPGSKSTETNQPIPGSKSVVLEDSKQSMPHVKVQPSPQVSKQQTNSNAQVSTDEHSNDTSLVSVDNTDVHHIISDLMAKKHGDTVNHTQILSTNTSGLPSNVTGVNITGANSRNPPINMTVMNKYTHRVSHTRDVTSATICVSAILILLFGMVLYSRMWQRRDQWLTMEEVLNNQAQKSQLPRHDRISLKDLIDSKLKFFKTQLRKVKEKALNSSGNVRKNGRYKEVHQVEDQADRSGSEDELYSR